MNKHYQSTSEIIRMAYSGIIEKVLDEIVRAHEKFPSWPSDIIHASAIVAEKNGKLTQATLKSLYEQGNPFDAEKEAIQVACTALRFLNNMAQYKKPVYRVKYSSYHYNTGAGDNFSGVEAKDFPTLEDALIHKAKGKRF